MPFDPSILSEIGGYGPNPVKAQSDAYTLAGQQQDLQMGGIQLGEAKQKQKDEAQVQELLKGAKLDTFEDQTKVAQQITKINPKMGMDFMAQVQRGREQAQKHTLEELVTAAEQADQLGGALDSVVTQLQAEAQKPGTNPAMLDAKAKQLVIPAALQLRNSNPALAQYIDKFLQNPQGLTYQGVLQAASQSKTGRENLRNHIAERKEQETERENRARDDRAERAQQKSGKPPAGFEWDPDKEDTLRPIKGGPKDTTSKPWSGREKVFSERIVASADQASRAIENITELPIGASTGVMGVGASPGHSVFEAGRDVLRNKLSSQEVQDYGTMLAGVRRNLATIETTGLTPAGSLTESFASLELREGDTQMTKLRKLAEMRQIVDAGLEVQLADPAIPDQIKNVMRTVLARVHKAVPFTQSDVTTLQRSQQKNPAVTLQQLIKNKGLDQGAAQPPPGVNAGERWATGPNGPIVLRNNQWVPVGAVPAAAPAGPGAPSG